MLLRLGRACQTALHVRHIMTSTPNSTSSRSSGKSRTPHEGVLVLPAHAELQELSSQERTSLLCDTHTHVLSTWRSCPAFLLNLPQMTRN